MSHFPYITVLFTAICISISAQPERKIEADLKIEKGLLCKAFKQCVGAGRVNEGLRADWQQQLKETKEACDFRYIRMHGLFADDMGVFLIDKTGKPHYNFQYVDMVYDFLLSIDIKPFVELSFMPSALASSNKNVFWWKGNVTLPKDFKLWAELVSKTTQHFVDRYGIDEVKNWYFEVWNEPDYPAFLYPSDTSSYFKLYQNTALAVKQVNQSLRVGGPATSSNHWIEEMIGFSRRNNLPLDFISTHTYGVRGGVFDDNGNSATVLDKSEWAVAGDMISTRQKMDKLDAQNLELHYTEWSSSYTATDCYHDTYQQAAYILDKIKRVGNNVNSLSYWVFTDIFEENGIRPTPFHGGFGLINYQGIRKPAFYAYKFLNSLSNIELQNSDACSYVCKDSGANFQVLLWDFTPTNPDTIANQIYYKKEIPSKSKAYVDVFVKNVQSGNYNLEIYKTAYRQNDAYSAYLQMGSPEQLNREQVKQLKQLSNGEAFVNEPISISNEASFKRKILITENEVILLKLTRTKLN